MQEDKTKKPFDPHEVDHGTMYHKMFWGARHGHLRGVSRGLIVGSAIGALVGIGLVAMAAMPVVGAAIISHMTLAMAGTVICGIAGFGGILGAELMGRIGNAAGNVSAQLAETELRERYPETPDIGPNSPAPGFGHHIEAPANRDEGKFFFPRVGLSGALLGGGFGALLSAGGIGSHLALGAPVLGPVAVGALFGSALGINRGLYKSIFNFTDNLLEGRLGGPNLEEVTRERQRYQDLVDNSPPSVITTLQRQEEFRRLHNEYFKKAFGAGFSGNARGLVGGMVSGGIFGSILGGIAALAIVAGGVTALGLAPAALAAVAFPLVVAATMKLESTHLFSEAAFEASGHGHVHEIHHERMKALRKGVDLDFEQAHENVVTRRQAHPDMNPPSVENKKAIKPRVMLLMGGLGAIVGLGFAPALSGVAHLLHLEGISMALSSTVMALTGATFGLGPAITGKLHGLGDRVFHGTFTPGDEHPDIKVHGSIPLMSPHSTLARHFLNGHGQEQTQESAQTRLPEHERQQETSLTDRMPAARASPQEHRKENTFNTILHQGARSLKERVQEPAIEPAQGVNR